MKGSGEEGRRGKDTNEGKVRKLKARQEIGEERSGKEIKEKR